MASIVPPKKNTAYSFEALLISQADTDLFQTSVTLAAGDVLVSKDGGATANIGTLPTEIGTSGILTVALTSDEMNADRVVVKFHDVAGDEWCDFAATIHTVTSQIDDLATSAALAVVDANVDAVLVDTGTTLDGKIDTIDTVVDAILADTGTDGVVLADDSITAAKIAVDAITSSELAASAAQEIADTILSRGVSNVEDSADRTSLAELILAAFESAIVGTTWTVYKTDHITEFGTRTVTTDASAEAITEVT